MAENQTKPDPEDADEFHVKVKERRGHPAIRARKGINRVTVPRGGAINTQEDAEKHVAKTQPGLEILGKADEDAPETVPAAPAASNAPAAAVDALPAPAPAVTDAPEAKPAPEAGNAVNG